MKRYIKYLFIIALGFFASACEEENLTDKEILDNRPSSKLEVSYAQGDAAVSALSLPHNAVRKELQVIVNNENLKWNLESNREWCVVVPEEHKGSGTVVLDIAANESFEDREQATLTFVAGQFRGFSITVDQSSSAFIIGQPYFVANVAGEAVTSKVTTITGTDWDIDAPDWITVSKGAAADAEGFTSTTLNITPAANTSSSRYGKIELSAGIEKDYIYVYQFGDDLEYDTAGDIFFPSGTPAVLTFTTPAFLVKNITTPDFAKGEVKENGDGTSTVTITMEDNLSDCGDVREVNVSLSLSNASASVVTIPKMVQDYVPAYGLVTGKGLVALAAAVAAGTPTTDWEKDGVITVIKDIDMNGITGWAGIGTKDHPFAGKFNGGGFAIQNLKNASAGLFNYTNGATIEDVTLAKGCSIFNNSSYTGKGCLGGIVSVAENTSLSNCSFGGDIEFSRSSEDDSPAYAGGIVGWADAQSSVKGAKMSGKLLVSTGSAPSDTCYAGGIAGLCAGTLNTSEYTGQINYSSGIGNAVLGGIQGALRKEAVVSNNSFMGEITLGGSASQVCIGGLYGIIASDRSFDNSSDKSIALGTINLDSYGSGTTSCLFVGGFAGKAEKGIAIAFKGYAPQVNISLDQKTNRQASYVVIGGMLGGSEPSDYNNEVDNSLASATFEDIASSGVFSTVYPATAVSSSISRCFVGGVAGFVNGKAVFKNCNNTGEIGKLTDGANSANTKHYIFAYGGIAGVVVGADAEFTNCENKGNITNKHYSNSVPGNTREGWYSPCVAAGILAAFDYRPTSVSGKLTMTGCVNGGAVVSYRGLGGGIVGYARNATITSCNNFGDLGQNSSNSSNAANKGGIASWLGKSSIKDCTSKCNVFCSNPADAVQSPGGILSVATDGGVTVSGCAYYGVLSVNKATAAFNCGCIVATPQADTEISNCKFGGKVNGADVTENTLANYVVGNGSGEVSGSSYWNGNS